MTKALQVPEGTCLSHLILPNYICLKTNFASLLLNSYIYTCNEFKKTHGNWY